MKELIKLDYAGNDIFIGGQGFQVNEGVISLEDDAYFLYADAFKSVGFTDKLANNEIVNQNVIKDNKKVEIENGDSDKGSGLSSIV